MDTQFTPTGRMRRTSYAVTLAVINLAMVGTASLLSEPTPGIGATRGLMMLALSWLLYCAMSRRLHDAGSKSTLAAILLGSVAFGSVLMAVGVREDMQSLLLAGRGAILVGAMIGLYVLIAPPSRNANRYGRNPRITKIEEETEVSA